jgi:hypothetical protein
MTKSSDTPEYVNNIKESHKRKQSDASDDLSNSFGSQNSSESEIPKDPKFRRSIDVSTASIPKDPGFSNPDGSFKGRLYIIKQGGSGSKKTRS